MNTELVRRFVAVCIKYVLVNHSCKYKILFRSEAFFDNQNICVLLYTSLQLRLHKLVFHTGFHYYRSLQQNSTLIHYSYRLFYRKFLLSEKISLYLCNHVLPVFLFS